jgi:hypothetical protein
MIPPRSQKNGKIGGERRKYGAFPFLLSVI